MQTKSRGYFYKVWCHPAYVVSEGLVMAVRNWRFPSCLGIAALAFPGDAPFEEQLLFASVGCAFAYAAYLVGMYAYEEVSATMEGLHDEDRVLALFDTQGHAYAFELWAERNDKTGVYEHYLNRWRQITSEHD